MGYWKSKVLPTINKVFKKDTTRKAAAAEACKSFDDSKEEVNKEFEEKRTELHPKVLEIYEALSTELKTLVKEPKDAGLKKHSPSVQKFLDELAKIEFPGSKAVSEACSKFGPAYVPGPVSFIFEKVSTFIPVEEKPKELPAAEETSGKEKEIVVEKDKKEEQVATEEAEKKPADQPPAPEAVEEAKPPAKAEEVAEAPPSATPVEAAEPPKPSA